MNPLARRARHALEWTLAREAPLDRILVGDQLGIQASNVAELLGQPLYASTPLARSPWVELLRDFEQEGFSILSPQKFSTTSYYRIGSQCIDILGSYFEARNDAELTLVARRFLEGFQGSPRREHSTQSHSGGPVHLRRVQYSNCFQIVDGHHRLAILLTKGQKKCQAFVSGNAVITPLQAMLFKVLWQEGRMELYQPVSAPEVEGWTVVRRCTDRFDLMRSFLVERGLMPPTARTYLDLGASYGWFVAAMEQQGFEAMGVERDPGAIQIGVNVYGLRHRQVTRSSLERYLLDVPRRFDVVSLFSVLHHFEVGRGQISALELIRLVDTATSRVLFFDTGQNHESWFRDQLPDWDPAFIESWLRKNTTFDEILALGTDCDAVAPYRENYGRSLFACVRN